jgi:hypothetical protein
VAPAQPLADAPLNALYLRIEREFHFLPTFSYFEKVIDDLTRENTFHPVR